MKKYSENIFNKISKIQNKISSIEIELKKEKYLELKQTLEATTENEIIINEELIYEKKIKLTALKLKTDEFDQMQELKSKLNKLEQLKESLEKLTNEKELLEYIYDLGIPITEEKIIEQVIEQCIKKDIDPNKILKMIIQENITAYNQKQEENKQDLNLDEDTKELIKEIQELLSQNTYKSTTNQMITYLLSLDEKQLINVIEQDISYKNTQIFSIMDKIIEQIYNGNIEEKLINLLYLIYETYQEKNIKIEQEEIKTKLIFLSKPTNPDLYIFDDIEKIQDKISLNIIKKEFQRLYKGNTKGKSLTGLPENLYEKKNWKIRITYKILPNNYILIINCYVKGNKTQQNIREIIEKNNVQTQIRLYEALAQAQQETIEQEINRTKIQTSQQEIENYIKNFEKCKQINLLSLLEEGEKKCLKQ